MTSRGMAAISSIALAGPGAQQTLQRIFRSPHSSSKHDRGEIFHQKISHGSIVDEDNIIDEVVIGCESEEEFIIHCHGNPLLVEQIAKLLQSYGAVLTDVDNFVYNRLVILSKNIIEAEARFAMRKSATLQGVRILQTQINSGLSKWAQQALERADHLDRDDFKKQCIAILEQSKIARYIIEGVRIVITGPPNSGKSTLLNCLAGQEQVIVSNTAGTTRDWVSVTAMIDTVRAEFIDTAGLNDRLAGKDIVEQTAQQITKEQLGFCDLILYTQDIAQNHEYELKTDKPVIYVYNKCDLKANLEPQTSHFKPVLISAKENTGIDLLIQKILMVLRIADFHYCDPVIFTQRQYNLMSELIAAVRSPRDILNDLVYSNLSL